MNVALAQHYARFTTRRLDDAAIVCASMASAVCESGAPGWELYLAHVAGHIDALPQIAAWAIAATTAWAREAAPGPTGQRRKARVGSFNLAWGASAIQAGVALSLWGVANSQQPAQLVSLPTWRKVRDHARDLTAAALEEYTHALQWAWGIERDRLLDERWRAACELRISRKDPRAIGGSTLAEGGTR